jgi:hypothetical protein
MGDTEILGDMSATLREQVATEILGLMGKRRIRSIASLARQMGWTNGNPLHRRFAGEVPFTVGELRAIAAILKVDASTLMPAVPTAAGPPVSSLSLDDIAIMASALGISPAEIMSRLGRTNSGYASLAGRAIPPSRISAHTGPNGHLGHGGVSGASAHRRPVILAPERTNP